MQNCQFKNEPAMDVRDFEYHIQFLQQCQTERFPGTSSSGGLESNCPPLWPAGVGCWRPKKQSAITLAKAFYVFVCLKMCLFERLGDRCGREAPCISLPQEGCSSRAGPDNTGAWTLSWSPTWVAGVHTLQSSCELAGNWVGSRVARTLNCIISGCLTQSAGLNAVGLKRAWGI